MPQRVRRARQSGGGNLRVRKPPGIQRRCGKIPLPHQEKDLPAATGQLAAQRQARIEVAPRTSGGYQRASFLCHGHKEAFLCAETFRTNPAAISMVIMDEPP